jgi:hypothetical protein
MIARNSHNCTARAWRGHPERVALALDDKSRNQYGIELGEAALFGVPWWMEWEGEADDADRAGRLCGTARDACTGRAPTGQDREPREWAVAKCKHDRRPRRVELRGRGRAAASRNPVGLLDEGDGKPGGVRCLGSAGQVGRPDSSASSVPEHERRKRRTNRVQKRTRRAMWGGDLEHPASVAGAEPRDQPAPSDGLRSSARRV